MEFYSVFQVIVSFGALFAGSTTMEGAIDAYVRVMFVSLAVAAAVWLVLFILQGVGLAKMAKNAGVKHRWLAFVPFVDLLYMGRLVGSCDVFGRKMKKPGIYTMAASVVSTVFCLAAVAAEILLFTVYRGNMVPNSEGYTYWELTGFGLFVYNFYRLSDFFLIIFELIYMILLFILLTGLYKKYYAKGYMILSWVGLLFPISRYIVVFVLRNNKAVDYEAYMRAKREEFLRRSRQNPYGPYGGQYGPYNQGGPYGGYNNGPYGGYNNGPYGANGPNAGNQNPGQSGPDDPFSEFAPGASSDSGTKNGGDGESGKGKSGDDDLFN